MKESIGLEPHIIGDHFLIEKETYEGILTHIITRQDLVDISGAIGKKRGSELIEIAESIRSMGLKSSDDFFADGGKGIYRLNQSALALLNYYCYDKQTTENVLMAIDNAFAEKKKNVSSNIQLQIPYDDIESCHETVFAKIFAYEILSGDMQRILADDFCNKAKVCKNADYVEAYVRAVAVLGEAPNERSFHICLSEVIERNIGLHIQKCQLNNSSKIEIYINLDVENESYPSAEIDKALKWLDDDAISVSYEYYVADISKAFGAADHAFVCFVFDEEKVILNKRSATNSMLDFVKKRYKGKDASFSNLVSIISEQNELKEEWRGTKKEYIERLSKYREITWKEIKVLAPDYDRHINDANGKAINYVLPELLQNINDCKFAPNQNSRTLDVTINIEKGTMMLCYDEAGFDYSNVYSITAIGQSSKHDKSEGEKGLGFKKVFTLFSEAEIYSNDFCFMLSAEKNTIPKWIGNKEKQERYLKQGKTVMIFTVDKSFHEKLKDIETAWKEIMDGQYIGNEVSPLFLKNIHHINLIGYEKSYSRDRMMDEFLYKEVCIVPLYEKLLEESDKGFESVCEIREILKTRRKCMLMDSDDERERYINQLSFELCIPKRVTKDNKGKGCFYSTLPTERLTHSALFMNVPLELTTGRDGIVDNSAYNEMIMKMLFLPCDDDGQSILNIILEQLSEENEDIFMLDYISFDIENMMHEIALGEEKAIQKIKQAFEHAKIFREYKTKEMVSLWDCYGVDRIVCQYLNTVENPVNDIDKWMQNHSENADGLKLILPRKIKECEEIEAFALAIDSYEGYYPVVEEDRNFALEYLMDEYGFIGGDDVDESIN